MNLNEKMVSALSGQGFTGTLDEMLVGWLSAQTGGSGSLNELWVLLLSGMGYSGTISEMQMQSWEAMGAPAGTWNEMASWFWENGGAYGPIPPANQNVNSYNLDAVDYEGQTENCSTDGTLFNGKPATKVVDNSTSSIQWVGVYLFNAYGSTNMKKPDKPPVGLIVNRMFVKAKAVASPYPFILINDTQYDPAYKNIEAEICVDLLNGAVDYNMWPDGSPLGTVEINEYMDGSEKWWEIIVSTITLADNSPDQYANAELYLKIAPAQSPVFSKSGFDQTLTSEVYVGSMECYVGVPVDEIRGTPPSQQGSAPSY